VELDQELPDKEVRDRVVAIKTSPAANREAKVPWKGKLLTGRAEGQYLFRTAISKNVLPFVLVRPPLVLLPLETKDAKGSSATEFVLLDHERMLERGGRYASKWFLDACRIWDKYKTSINKKGKVSLYSYLNWQDKLTNQNPSAQILVIYTSSATDASAVVVHQKDFNLLFLVDHKTYWCEVKSEAEGHYLCAYLNSGFANRTIKEFQSRGLFGPRDIHKTIVKLPYPRYEAAISDHRELSELGAKCAASASKMIGGRAPPDLQARALGRVRTQIREHLEAELEKIDALVEKLSTGKVEASIRSAGKGRSRRHGGTLRLFE
jgi:hypothetical protein